MVTDVLNQIIHAVNADLASFQPQFISNMGLILIKTKHSKINFNLLLPELVLIPII